MPSIVESAEARFERLLSGEPADTEATYSVLREKHPLLWSSAFNGWIVSRHADVRRVLESSEFAPLTEGAGTPMIYGRTVLAMSGEEHRKKTGLLARRIRNPRRLEEEVRPVVRSWSQEMANELPDGPTVFDIKAEFFTPLPLMVIARLMGTEGSEDFRGWYRDIVAGGMSNMRGDTAVRDRAVDAREQLFEYLRPRLEEMADGGRDDLLSDLVTMEYEGERMDIPEVLALSAFLLVAGIETTERTLTNLMSILVVRPDLWERLRNERGMVQPAIAEALRVKPPIHGLTRRVAQTCTLHGESVREGSRILALLAAANRDPRVFANADEFELDRFSENPRKQFTPKSDLLSFGAGEHHCTGSLLALVEMTEIVNALLDRYSTISIGGKSVPPDTGYILRSAATLPIVGYRDMS